MLTIELNQSKDAFRQWLRARHGQHYAIAGDCCHCWLGVWFESQGAYIWSVFPEQSQEVLLNDPEDDDFDEKVDRIPLESWACAFAVELDRRYYDPFKASVVTRNQALAVLAGVERC